MTRIVTVGLCPTPRSNSARGSSKTPHLASPGWSLRARRSKKLATTLISSSIAIAACVAIAVVTAKDAHAGTFSYDPPGVLVAGSGKGRVDDKVYAPGIRFPIEKGPAFANSQVWGVGGNSGPAGSQCDARNFSYPWHDNYCETRTWSMPLCPAGQGHQGQDVRASDCTPNVHPAVAVDDGTITSVGSYSVYLTRADGTRFDYLHMRNVAVTVGQKMKRGDRMGMVSNNFGTSSTTVHLHFNINQNVAGVGQVYVPPYLSLIQAYQTLENIGPGDAGVDGGSDVGVDAQNDTTTDDTGNDGQLVEIDTGIDDVAAPVDGGIGEDLDTGAMDDATVDAPAMNADNGGGGGCGCRTTGNEGTTRHAWWIALLVAVGSVARRKSTPHPKRRR